MYIKKISRRTLREALKPIELPLNEVSGDKAALNTAKAGDALARVKERVRNVAYNVPELDGVMTIEQLAIEPFKFSFVLQVPEIQEELKLPKPIKFTTLARVNKKDGPFTIEVTSGSGNFLIEFTDSELTTNLPGTKNSIKALVTETNSKKGKFYTVNISSTALDVIEKKETGGNEEEETSDKTAEELIDNEGWSKDKPDGPHDSIKAKYKNGEEITLYKSKSSCDSFKVNQEIIIKRGPNKGKIFIVKNKLDNNKVQIQKKGNKGTAGLYAIDCDTLIKNSSLKENLNLFNNILTEDEEDTYKNYDGRIYIKKIDLRPKAEKRREGDEQSYAESTGKDDDSKISPLDFSKWDGTVGSIPNGGALIIADIVPDSSQKLSTEQEESLKKIRISMKGTFTKVKIRKSLKVNDNQTFVVEYDDSGNKAIVCRVESKSVNLKSKPKISISPKAGAEDSLSSIYISANILVKEVK